MELSLFEVVGDLVRAMSPDDLGPVRVRAHRRGLKIWFSSETPPREHYEAQQLPRRFVDGREGLAIEIGFHAEHRDAATNFAVADTLAKAEKTWRRTLGPEPELAEFYGSTTWRRLSEAWIEPDLEDPEIGFEIASRVVDYVTAIEPIRS